MSEAATRAAIERWLTGRGWCALPFQREVWAAQARGESGLLNMPTGAGKTYAAYLGALPAAVAAAKIRGTKILYLTPLRALSRDIEQALALPLAEMKLGLEVAARTGDTSSYRRQKQRKQKPAVLVTTPESLGVLLSYPDAAEDFAALQTVVIDEWHELIGTKRGSLLELSLARLRFFSPAVKTWALSATLNNLSEAARAACGRDSHPTLVRPEVARPVVVKSLLPPRVDRFPWAGHLGLSMLPAVLEDLDFRHSSLIFTNTRSQAERWFKALAEALPEMAGKLGLHHGSLDRQSREQVEAGIKAGELKVVVSTSSLDLGVDLPPVERVYQVGSPKGIGRLVQRAGRSGHAPGRPCEIVCVPTFAWELLEVAACRQAIAEGRLEKRAPLSKPLDVLAQHLVTSALGGGFSTSQMLAEVRGTVGFQHLTDEEYAWTLRLLVEGGAALRAYPGFRRIEISDGRATVKSAAIARQHRLNIGTIVSDASILVRFARGGVLGTVEENYLSRLRPGDRFLFAGKLLELVRVRDLTAYVRRARGGPVTVPRWYGGRLPLSATLGQAVRDELDALREGGESSDSRGDPRPEIVALAPVLRAQREISAIPGREECLVETCRTREGYHLFCFPFEGRLVHEGLASLLAYRMARAAPATFALSANDYGWEVVSAAPFDFKSVFTRELFSEIALGEDSVASLNSVELARRQFREVARVAGLIVQTAPGRSKTSRQLQVSASLLFDVFRRHDPENLLVYQAQREVLDQQFEQGRLREVVGRLGQAPWRWVDTRTPSPLAFPLIIERMSAKLSTQTLRERIERMKTEWTKSTEKVRAPSAGSRSKANRSRSSPSGPSSGPAAKF